ncbi:MAG: hypothetical protein ACI4IQ_07075 [Eubacterium sp.]
MSSTNKTANLNLNSWIASDKPKREDFNMDNQIIDKTITEHIGDTVAHVTQEEKSLWNECVFTGTYFGNGTYSRTITTNCPFEAKLGFIFPANRPASVVKFSTSQKYNYLGFFSPMVNSLGVKLGDDRKSFTVTQSSTAATDNEYASLNESGVAYEYILFR